MRILSIVECLTLGGTERVCQNNAIGFHRLGRASAVLCLYQSGPRVEILRHQGVEVFVGGNHPAKVLAAIDAAAAWAPDVLLMHREGTADAKSDAVIDRLHQARGHMIPAVEVNHFARADRSRGRRNFLAHIHLSKWCLWKWQGWSRGLKPSPLGVLIPHMVDNATFRRCSDDDRLAFRRAHGVPDDAFLFGRIGQRSSPKWSELLFDAFERVAAVRQHAWLMLVGLPPELRSCLASLPEPIRRRIIEVPLLAGDELLCQAYSSMDCFAHAAAIGESFGMVLCEAMLCETPIVTMSTLLRDNSQVEVVGHQRGGLVCAGKGDFTEAMLAMCDDPLAARAMGRRGRDWVASEYAADVIVPRNLRLLELAARSRDVDTLRRALQTDPQFITEVSADDIHRLAATTSGRHALLDRLLLPMAQHPGIYATIRSLKRRVLRLR